MGLNMRAEDLTNDGLALLVGYAHEDATELLFVSVCMGGHNSSSSKFA